MVSCYAQPPAAQQLLDKLTDCLQIIWIHFYTQSYKYVAMSKQTRYISIFICHKHCSCFTFPILCQANSFNFILQQFVLLMSMTIFLHLTHSYICRFVLLLYFIFAKYSRNLTLSTPATTRDNCLQQLAANSIYQQQ